MKRGEQIGDPLNRPYSGRDCLVCGSPIVWRKKFLEDECQGCGLRVITNRTAEEIKRDFYET